MELALRDGDYLPDGRGGLRRTEGSEELLQRVLWKLTVRLGSFPFLPELGSRLYLLPREKPSARLAVARQYVAEALADERELEIVRVSLGEAEEGAARLRVELEWRGERLEVTA